MSGQRKRVKLFSLSTCPTCKQVKEFLRSHGVEFDVIEVDTLDSGEQWLMTKEVKKYNPQATYPTLVVEEVILGLDEQAIKRSLDIP